MQDLVESLCVEDLHAGRVSVKFWVISDPPDGEAWGEYSRVSDSAHWGELRWRSSVEPGRWIVDNVPIFQVYGEIKEK